MPVKAPVLSIRGIVAHKIGAWGEALTAFCLEREFEGLQIAMTSKSYVPFDMLVMDPKKTVFPRPAVMTVKTLTTNNSTITLYRDDVKATRDQAVSMGMELYISVVNYFLSPKGLLFGVYIAKAASLSDEDFVTVHTADGSVNMLRVINLRKKAVWTFHSGNSAAKYWKGEGRDPKPGDAVRDRRGHGGGQDIPPDRPGPQIPIQRPMPLEAGTRSPTIGFWGEYQTMMLLERSYTAKGLEVSRFDTPARDIDLYVLTPCKGTPFTRRASISCKVAERYQDGVPVSWERFKRMMAASEANEEDLWFSILEYKYKNRVLTFKNYMIKAGDIDKSDFKGNTYFGKKELFLNIVCTAKKAAFVYGTNKVGGRRRE